MTDTSKHYILDFKYITNPTAIEKTLSDWTITKHSERTFEIKGREYSHRDIISFWPCIGANGHIFIYDCSDRSEYYRVKRPKGRKREIARDEDLDTQTVQAILSFLDALEESSD